MGKPEYQLAWGYTHSLPIYIGGILRGVRKHFPRPLYMECMDKCNIGKVLRSGMQDLSHILGKVLCRGA